jgi:hypothetical protein
MFILYFSGDGHGVMGGVKEYLVILEDEPRAEDLDPAPGFILQHTINTDVDEAGDFPLPFDRILVPRGL